MLFSLFKLQFCFQEISSSLDFWKADRVWIFELSNTDTKDFLLQSKGKFFIFRPYPHFLLNKVL